MAWAYSHRIMGLERLVARNCSTVAAGVYIWLTTSVVSGRRGSQWTPS